MIGARWVSPLIRYPNPKPRPINKAAMAMIGQYFIRFDICAIITYIYS